MRIALLIQYDGSRYRGWQIQRDPQTIQGHLETALADLFGQRIGLTGSGRTDSGVHALGQVAHFDIQACNIPVLNLGKALNRQLPDDIRVIASQEVSQGFHSRFEARRRTYVYQIQTHQNVLTRNSQWNLRFELEMAALHTCAELIKGEHDFSSFCYAGTETENMICHIFESLWQTPSPGSLTFTISGDRFLHHMVRMLVGSMVEVARGKWELEHFKVLLENPDRQAHTITAPAHGLALVEVAYAPDQQPRWMVYKG